MHWPGSDSINRDIPPLPPPVSPGSTIREDKPGSAYGCLIVKRYTEYDASTRKLGIYYLLSTSRPYQVHLMHSQLHSRLGIKSGRLGKFINGYSSFLHFNVFKSSQTGYAREARECKEFFNRVDCLGTLEARLALPCLNSFICSSRIM